MIQSKISDSAYCDLEEHDAVSNPKIGSLVATHTSDKNERKIPDTDTTNRYSLHKLILNRLIPKITPGKILPIEQTIPEDVTGMGENLDAHKMVISKEIVTDAATVAHIFYELLGR